MRVLILILGIWFLELLAKHWDLYTPLSGNGLEGMVVLFFVCLVLDVIKK